MLANERKRIGKGRQGFAIPSRLTNGKGLLTQQLLRKNGHERKECPTRQESCAESPNPTIGVGSRRPNEHAPHER